MQALIASYFAKGDYRTVREITFFALKVTSYLLFSFVSLLIFGLNCFSVYILFLSFLGCYHFLLFVYLGLFFQTGLFTGIFLAVTLGVSFSSLATLFTNDREVLNIVRSVLLV